MTKTEKKLLQAEVKVQNQTMTDSLDLIKGCENDKTELGKKIVALDAKIASHRETMAQSKLVVDLCEKASQ